jgi:hypothetical protein
MIELAPQSSRLRAIDDAICAFRAKTSQKYLAMLCDSELQCDLFGCSIKRSITELNSDSHSQRFAASSQEPTRIETHGSCGSASSRKSVTAGSTIERSGPASPRPDFHAGHWPASSVRVCGTPDARAPRAEFISVSGQCPDPSAPDSDMRQSKRISGCAAATEPPHAPMNRSARRSRGGRVCLQTIVR